MNKKDRCAFMREIWQAWIEYCHEPKNKWDFYDYSFGLLTITGACLFLYGLLVVLKVGC